ncbi:hypothetical protein JYG33_03730 [Alcaligenes sp. SORT26]|uniref:hypothetical protein n=1 Tax=Alcaligenes sp. SORT26 TaxID=2813780 RepID=UPI001A9F3E8E|nr:hypothetical protein [Alcaligenes sp. SORT26]QTC00588.1 hypothetical protein JYG33_03730 [Alcaligenes sp. SORT26]
MEISTNNDYVVSGNLFSTTQKNTDLNTYKDAIHSNLFIQLVADNEYENRFNNPEIWMKYYTESLGIIFWNFIAQSNGTIKFQKGKYDFSIQEILEEFLLKNLEEIQKKSIIESIENFDLLEKDNNASQLYKKETTKETKIKKTKPQKIETIINLQITNIDENNKIYVFNIIFKTGQKSSGKIFEQRFLTKDLIGEIKTNSYEAEIIESLYTNIRQAIIQKLGEENIQNNILLVSEEGESPTGPTLSAARTFIREKDL